MNSASSIREFTRELRNHGINVSDVSVRTNVLLLLSVLSIDDLMTLLSYAASERDEWLHNVVMTELKKRLKENY